MDNADDNKNHIRRTGENEMEMQFTLPAWRLSEIIDFAARTLYEAEFYQDDFCYRRMISDSGILIKGYSQFLPENLEKMRAFSKSFWTEGLCLVVPPGEDAAGGMKMICYNDSYRNGEEAVVILHEFAHILLRHTEQSMNGEAEAICFAAVSMIMISLEKRFHFIKKAAERSEKINLSNLAEEIEGGNIK